jgi:hypothetical protein
MNIRKLIDIITEASIFTRPNQYSYGHRVKVSDSQKGQILSKMIQLHFPDYVRTEELEWIEPPTEEAVTIVDLAKSNNIRYFKRPNEEIFGVRAGDKTIESCLLHALSYNRGDMAEGILGAALSAKMIKRGSENIGNVTVDDIKQVLGRAIKQSDNALFYSVEDKGSKIADKISFTLRLPTGSMDVIKDTSFWPRFDDLFAAAEHYANTSDAERYSNYFYKNGKVDEVIIESDGVSDQKGTKTDIKAVVMTTNPKTGEPEKRTLKNIDISLKADSNIYGQHGTGGLNATKETWLANAQKLFANFGVTLTMPAKAILIEDFWADIYTQAADQISRGLNAGGADRDIKFIDMVADVIIHQATGGNKDLKLIKFEKGLSNIHSFSVLKKRLVDNNIQLDAKVSVTPGGKPKISIFDKNNPKNVLTNIRLYLGTTKASNYFEKGPLLNTLTKVEKQQAAAPQSAVQPAVQPKQPVAPQPATPEVQPELAESRASRIIISPPRQRR